MYILVSVRMEGGGTKSSTLAIHVPCINASVEEYARGYARPKAKYMAISRQMEEDTEAGSSKSKIFPPLW